MLSFDHVSKSYGSVRVLDEVSLRVPAGSVVALVGHNGAGKTTLMKTALGLVAPDAGEVRIGEIPVGRLGSLGGLRRLLRMHLRIWRAQRGVVAGTVLALAVGLAGVLFGTAMRHGAFTVASFGQQFVASTAGYTMLWLAVGAVAGAAPYRSCWAALVLVVAPRRLRWIAASFASVIGWALGTTAVLGGLSLAVAAGWLALAAKTPLAALGVLTHLAPVSAATLLNVTVGFALGAAARAVTAPLILGYVLAPAAPLLSVRSVHLGRWIDLAGTTQALAAGRFSLPVGTAVCLWVVAPALVVIWRLRRSPVA